MVYTLGKGTCEKVAGSYEKWCAIEDAFDRIKEKIDREIHEGNGSFVVELAPVEAEIVKLADKL